MRRTEVFRRQHREIVEVVGEMRALFDETHLKADAQIMRGLLSVLGGKLTIHLAMEDKGLYPRLLQHKNLTVRTLARAYQDEMGGIKDVFAEYLHSWPSAEAIQANAGKFIEHTKDIFAALGLRIEKEDNELYGIVDQEGASAGSATW
jgi:hypothetical protein